MPPKDNRTGRFYTMHGGRKTRLYCIWKDMRKRCRKHPRYAPRGITVDPIWDTFPPFRDWALAHGYTDVLSIDRIDNNGSYTPANCRWIPKEAQARNRRDNRAVIRSDGQYFPTVAEAAESIGIRSRYSAAICNAIKKGRQAGGFHWKYSP